MDKKKQTIIIWVSVITILLSYPIYITSIHPALYNGVELELASGSRYMEQIDRGIVAMYNDNGDVHISWRLLQKDPTSISFDLYRANSTGPAKLLQSGISTTTDYFDNESTDKNDVRYYVVAKNGITTLDISKNTTILNQIGQNYFTIPLQGNYTANSLGVGDLDGDGTYDYVIEQPNYNIDPALVYWEPSPGVFSIEAYLSNGSFLWRYNHSYDVEMGVWYSPYVVYDITQDGRAEVILKTSSGDHRTSSGRVKTGPEFLTVLDGMTGNVITQTDWIPRWLQRYNYNSRNFLGIAYLDGVNPYILMERGTYDITKIYALKFNNNTNELDTVWKWSSLHEYGMYYTGQSSHSMNSVDVDNDGCDEILMGSAMIDQNGKGLWSTGYRHPDHTYIGDIDPNRPGLEIYYGIEGTPQEFGEQGYGISLVDAKTGSILWGVGEKTYHVHDAGLVADLDPNYPGMEVYSGDKNTDKVYLHTANGTLLANENSLDIGFSPIALYWDEDTQRELLHEEEVSDYETGYIHNYIPGKEIVLVADIMGDWREEAIISTDGVLKIYTTTIPAVDRRATLMQDRIYRNDVAHLTMGYEQIPTTSYNLAYPNADKISPLDELNRGDYAGEVFWMNIKSFLLQHYLVEVVGAVVLITGILLSQFFIKKSVKMRDRVNPLKDS